MHQPLFTLISRINEEIHSFFYDFFQPSSLSYFSIYASVSFCIFLYLLGYQRDESNQCLLFLCPTFDFIKDKVPFNPLFTINSGGLKRFHVCSLDLVCTPLNLSLCLERCPLDCAQVRILTCFRISLYLCQIRNYLSAQKDVHLIVSLGQNIKLFQNQSLFRPNTHFTTVSNDARTSRINLVDINSEGAFLFS